MPKKTKIVIVGGGFGGTYTLKRLHKYFCGNPDIEISLIGEKNYFLFTPLLHEVATGGINPENIVEPVRKVLGCCISDFYLGKAEEINLKSKTVKVEAYTLEYDYLVLATGAETNFYNIPGAKENSLTLKSIEDAVKIKNQAIGKIEYASHIKDQNARKKALAFAIVGGGPTGVELAAELHELIVDNFSRYYDKSIINDATVVLIQKDKELLPHFGKKLREKSMAVLKKKGVQILLDSPVEEVHKDHLLVRGGVRIDTETIIWVAGVKPRELKFDTEVLRAPNGRLLVNEYLQIENYGNVFALGDIAALKAKDRDGFLPALAQVAEKEAKAVAKNIYRLTRNKKLEPFTYRHTVSLISLGQWMAIGETKNLSFSGKFTWWVWRTVYLFKLLSLRKKIKVAADWTVNLFYPRDISEL